MHHGKAICRISNLGHYDLDFDLYDSKTLSTSCPEQSFCTVAPRIVKFGVWMHYGKAMCPRAKFRYFQVIVKSLLMQW